MTHIDTQLAKRTIMEFRRVLKFFDGTETEYKGREYVEDETIMGNSEKIIYYCKETIANLTHQSPKLLDPFMVSKLDVNSISFHEFLKIPAKQNKYTEVANGNATAASWIIKAEKDLVAGMAKKKGAGQTVNIANLVANSGVSKRNIEVPSLLEIYCNLCELTRLRNEIILAASETCVLKKVYQNQCNKCKMLNVKSESAEGITFQLVDEFSADDTACIDYVNDGPGAHLQIELAVKDFDPALLSNFNFRNPDGLVLNMFTSGLEEVRAVLQYQIMQKHLLIIAIR